MRLFTRRSDSGQAGNTAVGVRPGEDRRAYDSLLHWLREFRSSSDVLRGMAQQFQKEGRSRKSQAQTFRRLERMVRGQHDRLAAIPDGPLPASMVEAKRAMQASLRSWQGALTNAADGLGPPATGHPAEAVNAALVIFVQRLGLFAASLGIDDRLDVAPMLRALESARVKNAAADAQRDAGVLRSMLNEAAAASRDDARQGAWLYGVCAKKAETWLMTYGDAADAAVKDAIVAVRDAAREQAAATATPAAHQE